MAGTSTASPASTHRVLVRVLLTLATVIGFWACLVVWINRQVLDTKNWANTSTEVIADPHVQEALSTYLVNELFSSVDVAARLKTTLPTQLQGVAGPLTAGLREVANRAVPRLLASPRVQSEWRRANEAAHAELLNVLNGHGKVLATSNGVVVLNLHELVTELGAQLGISSQVAAARSKLAGGAGEAARSTVKEKTGVTLSQSAGRIVIMRSSQLRTAQDITKAAKGLGVLLPLLSLAMFALAVALARGRRRRVLRATGWCLFSIGVAVLLMRRVGGDGIVNGLVANPINRPAAHAAWSIGTALLYDIAIAMVAYGLVLVAAAWLAGTTRPAVFLRRAVAPWVRVHAWGSYAAAGIVLLLVVFWGPTPATRQPWPVLGFAVLAALGVTALRRQTAAEFPDARPGDGIALVRASWPFGGGASRVSADRERPPATADDATARAANEPNGAPPAAPTQVGST